eukprot:gnl/MRDRNA2_/MRDRNA2_72169_c0_seq3.p1 gnl/MRDRNA2_/MRDRNA2_72169_c0~~gnl/MRDRNA2_/MRDRNA2_72169_c0_seq3.p1  ORF type:complete len:208 (-),score=23.67 gnl/MRDRNA2_/MRDRNA2_72169_c0_seq3:10-633(-)
MDIFPEFLRPNILKILQYVTRKKRSGACRKVMIYTNNQGPWSWPQMIASYFDTKTGLKTFDHIVYGEFEEIVHGLGKRTKSFQDLTKCTGISSDIKICFYDDRRHPLMEHDNVDYFHLEPYEFNMMFWDMAERYYAKAQSMGGRNKFDFVEDIVSFSTRYYDEFQISEDNVTDYAAERHANEVVSQKMMTHLRAFFARDKSQHRLQA